MPKRKKPTVAIVGASADRSKFGNKSVRAHLAQGFDVYPVNPKGGQVEGLPVYLRLADVPAAHLDRVSLYVPPAVGLSLLPEIAAKGYDERDWLLIDIGYEDTVEEIIELVRQLDFPLSSCQTLVATHADVDHIQGLAKAKTILKTTVTCHPLAARTLEKGDRLMTFAE